MSWNSAGARADQPLDQRHQGRLAGEAAERCLALDEARELSHMPGAQLGIERRQAIALLAVHEAGPAAGLGRHLAIAAGVERQMVAQGALVPDHGAAGRIGARHRLELRARREHVALGQQPAHHEEAVVAIALERGREPGLGRRHAVVLPLERIEVRVVQRDLRLVEDAGFSRHAICLLESPASGRASGALPGRLRASAPRRDGSAPDGRPRARRSAGSSCRQRSIA